MAARPCLVSGIATNGAVIAVGLELGPAPFEVFDGVVVLDLGEGHGGYAEMGLESRMWMQRRSRSGERRERDVRPVMMMGNWLTSECCSAGSWSLR